ncbi:MAG: ADP-glyceromanno-heptose 6-epimerase [Ignavibacteria bacterium]|nr:ADP-glyceromanno-heptose 6-epimerase [Ignavibacteria bacterium]
MKIITGGAGFIGSAICWHLNKSGYNDILIVDDEPTDAKQKNLNNLKYSDFIQKEEFINKINKAAVNFKVSSVYHMGACSSTTETNMDFLNENNVEYSKSLGKWCLNYNVKYIYASSAATYGDGSNGFDDDYIIIPKLKPLNKYGLSKQLFDMWVLENKLENKFVGLKYFNVFGPNENHKGDMRSMVNKAYTQINETGKLKLFRSLKPEYKDGEQLRDFIYIKDAVEMTVFFDSDLGKGKDKSGIYNIGSGTASTWLDAARAVFNALGKEINIEWIDIPENIRNQYQYYSKANINKLRSAGFDDPIMNLDVAINDYIKNYLMKGYYLTL